MRFINVQRLINTGTFYHLTLHPVARKTENKTSDYSSFTVYVIVIYIDLQVIKMQKYQRVSKISIKFIT